MSLDATFAALSDPTRRAILTRLAEGEATVGELAEPFRISLPAISRHLRVLEEAELIVREREGQHRRCRLKQEALVNAGEWLDFHRRFWSGTLDRLNDHLKQEKQNKGDKKP
ncbi:MAG TPA: metalloregulator ArsR/SmtB family transcription factor [Rhizomicrobium sp.]|nr:metalloregulator ArsR/SmtB family transcription factor [Rhizomicrobium sp.]